ncbi:MAG: hypothetical protein ACOCZ8_02495 [Bacteroidota bacterium]
MRLLIAVLLCVTALTAVGCTETCYDCVKRDQVREVCDAHEPRLDDDLEVYENEGWRCTARD